MRTMSLRNFGTKASRMARSTRKLKVCLCGRHAKRTPTAYAAYRPYLSEFLEFVEDPTGADLLIFGFWIDIQDAIKDQKNRQKNQTRGSFRRTPLGYRLDKKCRPICN